METRTEKFEAMLESIISEYHDIENRMEELKSRGKAKSVTFQQLMASKFTLQKLISRYEYYDLITKVDDHYVSTKTQASE